MIAANAGVPWSARSRRGLERGQLVVPADQRPGRQGRDEALGARRGCGGPDARRAAADAGGARPGDGAGRAAPRERRVLPEHRGLEVAQLGAGLEAELGVEHLAHLAQRVERVGLAAGPGERERAQRPQPLAERVRRGERLELGGDRAVVPEGERGDGPVLEGDAAQLLEPGPLGDGGGGVLELDVRDPAPERERVVELVRGGRELLAGQGRRRPEAVAVAEPPVRVGDGAVEAGGVERASGRCSA